MTVKTEGQPIISALLSPRSSALYIHLFTLASLRFVASTLVSTQVATLPPTLAARRFSFGLPVY